CPDGRLPSHLRGRGPAARSVDPGGRRLRTGRPARPPCRERRLPSRADETARPEGPLLARARRGRLPPPRTASRGALLRRGARRDPARVRDGAGPAHAVDRKSTRLNSSHVSTSYAVSCLRTT